MIPVSPHAQELSALCALFIQYDEVAQPAKCMIRSYSNIQGNFPAQVGLKNTFHARLFWITQGSTESTKACRRNHILPIMMTVIKNL